MPIKSPLVNKILKNSSARIGLFITIILILMGILAPLIAPMDPNQQSLENKFLPPLTENFLMGTDALGQDIFSRILYGTRISLILGVTVCLFASLIGLTLGSLAAWYGGIIDLIIMRITDIVLAFPFLILAIAVMAIFERPSLFIVFIVLGAVSWADVCRLIRGQILVNKELDYISAARAIGQKEFNIITFHILPNSISPIIVWFSLRMAQVIMTESSLSFLGLGAEPGTPSWGNMMNEGFNVFRDYYWVALFPGITLALTVFGFNLLGDGLQDVLNPKTK